jgi:hypothetical protein
MHFSETMKDSRCARNAQSTNELSSPNHLEPKIGKTVTSFFSPQSGTMKDSRCARNAMSDSQLLSPNELEPNYAET